jgi:membrane protease YdiL (CAAX protease family)
VTSTPPETVYPAQPIFSPAVSGTGPDLPTGSQSISPDDPPWGILAAVLTWFASFAFILLVPNILTTPYIAYRYQEVVGLTQQQLMADKTVVFLLVLGWVPAHLLTLALIWAVATRLRKYSFRDVFGFSWSPNLGLWKSAGLAILLFIVAWLITSLFSARPTDLDQILQSSRAAALTMAFLAVATAPLVEELTYRGLLYSALQRVIGRWFAVVVVTSMFAGLHVWQYRQNIGVILSITLLSLVLTTVRARTGRLLPCFVIHLVFNGVSSLIIVFGPYLRTPINLSPDSPSGFLIFIWRNLA